MKEALAAISEGGYAEAVTRVASLLTGRGEPVQLAQIELKRDLEKDYHDLLPQLEHNQARRIRGRQETIVKYEPDRAVETLPDLLHDAADRSRLLQLMERVLTNARVQQRQWTPEQLAMLTRIRNVLGVGGPRLAPVSQPARKARRR